MPIYKDLIGDIDSILGVRDDIGAELKHVYLVTRTWSGMEIGDGTSTEVVTQMLPTPRIVELMDDYRIREGGAFQQGDVLLKMVSKQSYVARTDVDCFSNNPSVEKFYRINDIDYRVINVQEKHVTWNVQLRRMRTNGS